MKPWTITWDELEWTDETVNSGIYIAVADLVDEKEAPSPWDGINARSAFVAVLLSVTRPTALDPSANTIRCLQEVYQSPLLKLQGCLTERIIEDDEPALPPVKKTAPKRRR